MRGPDRQARPDIQDWPIVAGKAEGVQPGYRVQDPEKHLWQIEFDPPSNPEMASAVEVMGTAFYHALGYNVVEVYITDVDPAKIRIAPNARMRVVTAPKGVRSFVQEDLHAVLARAARRPDGRVRVLASRFADGSPLGSFRRRRPAPRTIPTTSSCTSTARELRANRVFAAWLNHDDSRGLNSLDMLERVKGKAWVKHYMFDFGSIMGSGTVFAQKPRAGNEYILETRPGLLTALTFGLYFKPWITFRYPDVPASVGRFEGTRFKPEAWKPEYPNPAFQNMRPDDAFWGARLVARFTPEESQRSPRASTDPPHRLRDQGAARAAPQDTRDVVERCHAAGRARHRRRRAACGERRGRRRRGRRAEAIHRAVVHLEQRRGDAPARR